MHIWTFIHQLIDYIDYCKKLFVQIPKNHSFKLKVCFFSFIKNANTITNFLTTSSFLLTFTVILLCTFTTILPFPIFKALVKFPNVNINNCITSVGTTEILLISGNVPFNLICLCNACWYFCYPMRCYLTLNLINYILAFIQPRNFYPFGLILKEGQNLHIFYFSCINFTMLNWISYNLVHF